VRFGTNFRGQFFFRDRFFFDRFHHRRFFFAGFSFWWYGYPYYGDYSYPLFWLLRVARPSLLGQGF
jgi:hypothetical protein